MHWEEMKILIYFTAMDAWYKILSLSHSFLSNTKNTKTIVVHVYGLVQNEVLYSLWTFTYHCLHAEKIIKLEKKILQQVNKLYLHLLIVGTFLTIIFGQKQLHATNGNLLFILFHYDATVSQILRMDFPFKYTAVHGVGHALNLHKPLLSFVFWHDGSTSWKQLKGAFKIQVNNRSRWAMSVRQQAICDVSWTVSMLL